MKLLLSAVLVTNIIVFSLFSSGFASLLDNRCGTSVVSPRLSGGNNAVLMSKPWMVYLHTSHHHFICGGSLISPWFILTAAHCFDEYNYTIIWARLGEHNSDTPRDCNYKKCAPLAREYLVLDRIRHPFYAPGNPRKYDIALGRLSHEVDYTASIRPICVVLRRGVENYVDSRKFFVVSGWGATPFADKSSILQSAKLKHVDRFICHYYYGYNVDQSHICAGDAYHYVGKGDSGSPLGLMMEHNGDMKFVQFGIVSHIHLPYSGVAVFTNVLAYTDWISQIVNSY